MFTEFGQPDVLGLEKVERPTPRPNEVLIRVRATAVFILGEVPEAVRRFGDAKHRGKIVIMVADR